MSTDPKEAGHTSEAFFSNLALTPISQTVPPNGSVWVAYHDLARMVGRNGLAMTWRGHDGDVRWVAAFDRSVDGRVTAAGRLVEGQDLSRVISLALMGSLSPWDMLEPHALAILFPCRGHELDASDVTGLPNSEDHIELAHRAVAEADLKPAMRAAFQACLDHGVARDISLVNVRRMGNNPEWESLTLAARHPGLVRVVQECAAKLLIGRDPLGTIRRHWPGMTDAHVRRLRDDACPKGVGIRNENINTVRACLDLAFGVPVDWWPRAREWTTFEACALAIGGLDFATRPHRSPGSLAASSGGDWNGFIRRLHKAAGFGIDALAWQRLRVAGMDSWDPVQALVHAVTLPMLAAREDATNVARLDDELEREPLSHARAPDGNTILATAITAAHQLIYGEKSAPSILETSWRWHSRQNAMQAEIQDGSGELTWPALFEGEFRFLSYGIVAVSDLTTLREEGAPGIDRQGMKGLDHCVASRLPSCLSKQSHILSVRMHSGDTVRRMSTCEVSVDVENGRPVVTVVEHRGLGNLIVHSACEEAVEQFREAIADGTIPLVPEVLLKEREGGGSGITRLCGYDWKDEEARDRAVTVWEPFLPRWARGRGMDGLYEAMVTRGVLPDPGGEPGDETGEGARHPRRG